jgi:ribosomal-protein-alanine N-acetyltransferase
VLLPSEIRALIAGDSTCASKEAGVTVPPASPESDDAREGLPWHLRHLESDERHRAWRIRVVVHRDTNLVIGSVNLKGPPDVEDDVEIGWGISEAWRRRGYALESVAGVIVWALKQPATRSLTTAIAAGNLASQQLAEKLGFVRTEQVRQHKPVWLRSSA